MQNMMFLLLLLIIPVGIFLWYRNKKKKQNQPTQIKNRKTNENNESWQTVKKYLKERNEIGKEVIDLYVTKRKTDDELKTTSKEFKANYKEKQKQEKEKMQELKKNNPVQYKQVKKDIKNHKEPELWLLVFTTRSIKGNVIDKERIIEAEIKYLKISKKKTERKIFIHDDVDYDKEMKWIQPLKEKEQKELQKNKQLNEKKQLKVKQKESKKKQKAKENIQDAK